MNNPNILAHVDQKSAGQKKGIRIGDYILKLPHIGEGNFGKVYSAKNVKTGNMYAAKKMDIKAIFSKPKRKEKFAQELKVWTKLNHVNIIRLYDVLKTSNNFYLIQEYCDGDSLANFLNKYTLNFSQPPGIRLIQHFVKQIVSGLYYLQRCNSIHRDIKLENIMLTFEETMPQSLENGDKDGDNKNNKNLLNKIIIEKSIPLYDHNKSSSHIMRDSVDIISRLQTEKAVDDYFLKSKIKIIDMGFAKELEEDGKTFSICGSPLTMAPEIWDMKVSQNKSGYDYKVDIWSLGVVVYYLFTGFPPFLSNEIDGLVNKIKTGDYTIPGYLPVFVEFLDFLNGLLQYHPNERINWNEIISHPFIIKDVNEFSLLNKNEDIRFSVFKRESFLQSIYYSTDSSVLKEKDNHIQPGENNKIEVDNKEEEIALSDSYIDRIFINDYVMIEIEVDILEQTEDDGFLIINLK